MLITGTKFLGSDFDDLMGYRGGIAFLGIGAGMGLFKQQTAHSAVENKPSKLYRPLAFAALKDDELVAIYNVAPIKNIAEGTVVVAAEAQQDSCYVIMSGSCRLVRPAKGATITLTTFGRGEWFGRMGSPETLP